MNILNDYIKKLDNGFYDCEDVSKINEEFNEILNQLKKDGENKTASLADLDRQVFYVHKSFDYKDDPENGILNGLSWKYSGTKTLEDGSQTPFYWPDIKSLTQENFEFFEKFDILVDRICEKLIYKNRIWFNGLFRTKNINVQA